MAPAATNNPVNGYTQNEPRKVVASGHFSVKYLTVLSVFMKGNERLWYTGNVYQDIE